jgi:hypothetical protein
MSIEKLYKQHVVKVVSDVSKGSGCILLANSSAYNYVFTAKHCISKNNKYDKEKIKIIFKDDQKEIFLDLIDVKISKNYDIAIILVKKKSNLSHMNIYQPKRKDSVVIYGYPHDLENSIEQRQNIDCDIDFCHDEHFEIVSSKVQFTFEKSMPNLIQGFSGSGIFFEYKEKLCLCGILVKLKGEDGSYNSMCSINIKLFKNLLEEENLASITLDKDNFSQIKTNYDLLDKVFSISYNEESSPYYLTREIDRVFINYLKFPKHIWLSGNSGVGKTISILHNIIQDKRKILHIDLTCSETEDINEYFEYVNRELINLSNIKNAVETNNIFDDICNNLNKISNINDGLIIFVDEVPIGTNKKFYDFLTSFINIIEKYKNLNRDNKIKWIISTRIDPHIHLNSDESCHQNKSKANNVFIFNNLKLWDDLEIINLLKMLEIALDFQLSDSTINSIVRISKGLPGRTKRTIENLILEECSIEDSIAKVEMEMI